LYVASLSGADAPGRDRGKVSELESCTQVPFNHSPFEISK